MRIGTWSAWLLAGAMAPVMAASPGAATSSTTAKAALPDAFDLAAPQWRDYLRQAHAARAIADPLARCLAFPDLPGNTWPRDHAASHCRNHYERAQLLPAEMSDLLARGDAAGLRKRLDALQRLHGARGKQQSEDIHYVFNRLDANAESDALTARWLELAPDEPYAKLARASYLRREAWHARGGGFANTITEEGSRTMHRRAAEAIALLQEAATDAPDLMPIYEIALDAAKIAGRDDVVIWAMEQAQARDRGCTSMARNVLDLLKPRWGGSYEEMGAYIDGFRDLVPKRPLLAQYLGAAQADQGDWQLNQGEPDAGTVALLDTAVRLGSAEDYLRDAAHAALRVNGDRWSAAAYLLQAERFAPNTVWAEQQLVQILQMADPEGALEHARHLSALEPDNRIFQVRAMLMEKQVLQFAQAEQALRGEPLDPQVAIAALAETGRAWLYGDVLAVQNNSSRARVYVERLLELKPDSGIGWVMRFDLDAMRDQKVSDEVVQNVLRYADRSDRWQAERAARVTELARQLDKKR